MFTGGRRFDPGLSQYFYSSESDRGKTICLTYLSASRVRFLFSLSQVEGWVELHVYLSRSVVVGIVVGCEGFEHGREGASALAFTRSRWLV